MSNEKTEVMTAAEWARLFAQDLVIGCSDEMLGGRVSMRDDAPTERVEPTATSNGGFYVQAWIFVDDIEVEAAEAGDSDAGEG
jgi:hypothetical protein